MADRGACDGESFPVVVPRIGRPLAALSFGSQSEGIKLPDGDELGIVGASFSIDCWVYIHVMKGVGGTEGLDNCIIGTRTDVAKRGLHCILRRGRPQFAFFHNDIIAPHSIPTKTWVHLAFVYDLTTTTQQIFMNGDLIASESGHPPLENGNVFIGSYLHDRTSTYGFLADVRIWNKCLDGTTIMQLMKKSVTTLSGDPSFEGLRYAIVCQVDGTAAYVDVRRRVMETIPVDPRRPPYAVVPFCKAPGEPNKPPPLDDEHAVFLGLINVSSWAGVSLPTFCEVLPSPLVQTLHAMQRAGVGCDVEFVCADDTPAPLHAHKLVLAASCPYFHALFYGPMASASQPPGIATVRLPDFTPKAVTTLVQLCYSIDMDCVIKDFTSFDDALELLLLINFVQAEAWGVSLAAHMLFSELIKNTGQLSAFIEGVASLSHAIEPRIVAAAHTNTAGTSTPTSESVLPQPIIARYNAVMACLRELSRRYGLGSDKAGMEDPLDDP
jgi:hypothetical protein